VAAGAPQQAAQRAAAAAPLVGASKDASGGRAADGVHLGLSHNDVLARLVDGLGRAREGKYLPAGFKSGLALAAGETVVRGVPLAPSSH
jgi:hypothetical protein